jgi:hypothetical protein
MREQLIEAREKFVRQIREFEKQVAAIDAAMKFFDAHPDMEIVAGAMSALVNSPAMPYVIPGRF